MATDITVPSPRPLRTPNRSGEYDQRADDDHHDYELKELTELHGQEKRKSIHLYQAAGQPDQVRTGTF